MLLFTRSYCPASTDLQYSHRPKPYYCCCCLSVHYLRPLHCRLHPYCQIPDFCLNCYHRNQDSLSSGCHRWMVSCQIPVCYLPILSHLFSDSYPQMLFHQSSGHCLRVLCHLSSDQYFRMMNFHCCCYFLLKLLSVPWSCHHYKICLPWFYSGGDLILYPDTGLRGAWNIYRLCGSSHGVLCRCLRPDGDGDLETQDEHKKTFIRHREQALGRKEKLNKRLSTKISVGTGQ